MVAANVTLALVISTSVTCAAHAEPVAPLLQSALSMDARQPYLEFKSTTLLDWHPITKQALVRTGGDAVGQQLQLVDGAGGKLAPLIQNTTVLLQQTTGIGKALFQPRVGSYLVYEKLYEKSQDQATQLFRFDLVAKIEVAISPVGKHASNLTFNRQGDKIVYTAQPRTLNAEQPSTGLYLIDPLKPDVPHLLATLKGDGYSDFNFSPDDKSLVYVQTIARHQSRLWQLNITTGVTKILTPAVNDATKTPYSFGGGTAFGSWASPRHSADGKSLFVLCDFDSNFKRLCKLNIDKSSVEFLTKFTFDIDEFLISVRQNRLALLTNEQGGNGLRFIDLMSLKELPRPPLIIGDIHGMRWRGALDSDDSEGVDGIEANKKPYSAKTELGFTLATARGPQDVFTAQVGGRITRWTNSASTLLNPMDFVEPTQIVWKSADNKQLTGFYYAPDPTKFSGKRPVIIKLPNDNVTQFKPGFIGRDNYFINVLGIAVIYPNIGGTKEFGKTVVPKHLRDRNDSAIKNIGALLDWVATQPTLDEEKILFSEAALRLFSSAPDTYRTSNQYAGNALATAISSHYANKITKVDDMQELAKFLRIEPRYHDGRTAGATLGIRN